MKFKQIFISKFSQDTIWLAIAQVAVISSGLFINIFLGNQIGIENLGLFHQSLAFYLILSTLFALGLNNSLIKKVSEVI
ncbi:MAG: oligosaccharide flippase family protein [Crocinitomicaceae bacterium]|nr:oligosaccharide flippase family protein [Crocinitomicaceae bacterium]